jgi:hypothetical protein
MLEEPKRVLENLKTIRDYLTAEFPGFLMTEDTSTPSVMHRITMTNPQTYEQYKLKIGWPRLCDQSNTPEKTSRSLVHGDVAYKMRKAKGDYLYW